jgi:putative ABC transport system permease protein
MVCGVATVVALEGASGSVVHAARDAVVNVAGRAQLLVDNGKLGVPEALVERVRAVKGVAAAAPLVEANAAAVGLGGEPLKIFGIDLLDDQSVRTYELSSAQSEIRDPLELLARLDSLLLTREFAERKGLAIGETLELLTPRGVRGFLIAGLLEPKGAAAAFGGDIALMDIFAAQKTFGTEGRFDRIDVVADESRDLDVMREAIATAVGASGRVSLSERYESGIRSQISTIAAVVRWVSLIGLCMSAFLIYNTLSISVAQRRREFATVRLLGVTAGQLRRQVLCETMLLALPACTLGLPLGLAGAHFATGVFAETIGRNIANIGHVEAQLGPTLHVATLGLGLGAALLGAASSAGEAAHLKVLVALRREQEVSAADTNSPATAWGLLCLASGALLAILERGGSQTSQLFVFVLFGLGATLCLPDVIRRMAPALRWFLGQWAPVIGKLAADNICSTPRRSATSGSTIMLAAAAVVSLRVVLASLLAAAQQWGNGFFPLDLMVTSGTPMYGTRANLMPGELGDAIKGMPGVEALNPLRIEENVPTDAGDVRLIVQDFELWRGRAGRQLLLQGTSEKAVEALARGDVFVSENFSRRTGRHIGDQVTVQTPDGPHAFRIAGVYAGGFLSHPNGTVEMDLEVFRRRWNDRRATSFNLFLSRDASPRDVTESVRRRYGRDYALFVIDREEFQQLGFQRLEQAFSLTQILELILVALSAFSVVNTLVASVLDRVHDIALLRVAGATSKQISRGILLEAGLLGIVGIALGGALGAVAARSLLGAFVYFDWYVPYRLPGASLITSLAALLLVVLLSAWYPARRGARVGVIPSLQARGI